MSLALNKTRAIFVDRTELANQKSTNTTCVSGAATARYSSSPKASPIRRPRVRTVRSRDNSPAKAPANDPSSRRRWLNETRRAPKPQRTFLARLGGRREQRCGVHPAWVDHRRVPATVNCPCADTDTISLAQRESATRGRLPKG